MSMDASVKSSNSSYFLSPVASLGYEYIKDIPRYQEIVVLQKKLKKKFFKFRGEFALNAPLVAPLWHNIG